jgi:redox-sensing transcriptional repressor
VVPVADGSRRRIPEATVARLPLYYRALVETAERKTGTISSERLAEMAGVNAAKVRKDLSYLGSYGTRGVGYDVEYLLGQISHELGLTEARPVMIVGVGRLGQALANYAGFGARGFRVVALLDSDASKIGARVGGLVVEPLDQLVEVVRQRQVAIAILAVPAEAAQRVADQLVDAGVSAILNFAPTVIAVPEQVALRKVDLAIELQILSFYQQRNGVSQAAEAAAAEAVAALVTPPGGPLDDVSRAV